MKMKVKISLTKANGATLSENENDPYSMQHPGCLEPTFSFFDSFAWAPIREISLRPGMKLVVADFVPPHRIIFNYEVHKAPLEFGFWVEGKARLTYNGGQNFTGEHVLNRGSGNIVHFSEDKGTIDFQPHKRVRFFSIHIDPQLFQSLHEENYDGAGVHPEASRQIVSNNRYLQRSTMSPSMMVASHQILNCPYQGATGRIYLEAKALELIALQTRTINLRNNERDSVSTLRPIEREQIHQANHLLTRELADPPSLVEIAHSVGLTHTRLNQGFKEIYGTTVFKHLRMQRLEYGRFLLEEGKLSISEVAYAAGFSSHSHFGKSFLEHFGIQPSVFQKEKYSQIR